MATIEVVADQLDRIRAEMAHDRIDLLLITPSADLLYLIGYGAHVSERPTILAVTADDPAVLLLPVLEAPRLPRIPGIIHLAYEETDNPITRLHEYLSEIAVNRAMIGDQTWAVTLLRLQAAWPDTRFEPASGLTRRLRMRKSAVELALLAEAGARTDLVFSQVIQLRFTGRTEREIASELDDLLRAQGLQACWQIVASGPNSASPHHLTGERTIHDGDALLLDFGGALEGYQSDTTRTVHVGNANDEFRRVYDVVRQAQETGVHAVHAGVNAQSVDRATRGVISAAGYGDFFIHRTGHGLGLEIHEEPYVVEGNDLTLETGMVFSVEPGIYLPNKFGVRIEDIVAVTADGSERLNTASRDLVVVH